MRVIDDNVDQLVAHLRFPLEHGKRTRSTNLLEGTFVEARRRTKIIGRFAAASACPRALLLLIIGPLDARTNPATLRVSAREDISREFP